MSKLNFIIFHVGGRGNIVGDAFKIAKWTVGKANKAEIYVFEADITGFGHSKRNKRFIKRMKKRYDIYAEIFPYCISDHNGKEKFYINRDARSSSLFKIDEKAKLFSYFRKGKISRWIDHCSVEKTAVLNVTTFDHIYRKSIKKIPDFLSIDAQGSEYSILLGSSCFLNDDLLGVISEAEFRKIYENQPLFSDQDMLLRNHDFIFINFLTIQNWFLGPHIGNDYLTVVEVLYLRDYSYFVKKYKANLEKLFPVLTKLAMVSNILGFSSYSYIIIDYIIKSWPKEWEEYVKNNDDRAIQKMNKLHIKTDWVL